MRIRSYALMLVGSSAVLASGCAPMGPPEGPMRPPQAMEYGPPRPPEAPPAEARPPEAMAPMAYGAGPMDQNRGDLPPPPPGQSWSLAWGDEFNGDAIDPAKWNLIGDGPRDGGYSLKQNVSVHDGLLHIKVSAVNGKLATGGIDSRGKAALTYGYFEARCRLPLKPGGFRTAFWVTSPLVNTVGNNPDMDGRNGTEMDIFEEPGRSGTVDTNLHWDGYGPMKQAAHFGGAKPIDYDHFHTFGMWWSPDSYKFYIDGQLTQTTRAGGVAQVPESVVINSEALNQDPNLAQDVAIASSGQGDELQCDYVRVYQLH